METVKLIETTRKESEYKVDRSIGEYNQDIEKIYANGIPKYTLDWIKKVKLDNLRAQHKTRKFK